MSELVRVLRRHRWIALLGFLIPVVAAFVLTSMASATYEARAEVLFRAQVVDPLDQQAQFVNGYNVTHQILRIRFEARP